MPVRGGGADVSQVCMQCELYVHCNWVGVVHKRAAFQAGAVHCFQRPVYHMRVLKLSVHGIQDMLMWMLCKNSVRCFLRAAHCVTNSALHGRQNTSQ